MLASHVCGWLLLGGVAAGVVPDAHERFLQHLLRSRRFPQDTERDSVQMRRRPPIELGERRLVGERGPREQLGERRAAVRARTVSGIRRGMRAGAASGVPPRSRRQSTSSRPAARFSDAREHEQEVGEPVQVAARRIADRRARGEVDERALGAAADGARDVRERGRARAARQDEFLERRERRVAALDRRLEPRDVRVAERRVTRESTARRPGRRGRAGRSMRSSRSAAGSSSASRSPSVELSSSTSPIAAIRARVLGHARPVAEAGGPGVAGAGDDA